MRAIFYSFDSEESASSLTITGEQAHHLNVVRIQRDDELLLLNGKGTKLFTKVVLVDKKFIEVEVLQKTYESYSSSLTLAIATPKKEAFEDILKICVEMGIMHIQPLSSHFSQYEFKDNERTMRLLESALIQSNNSWFPKLSAQKPLKKFLEELSYPLYFFNSRPLNNREEMNKVPADFGVLVGPEGGFSAEEVQLITSHPLTISIHLPTPILRAPTAVAASIGFLLALRKS